MRFIIDENVRKEVIDFLRRKGDDILTLPAGTSDEKIAKTAKEVKRVILTHDRHFADILMYPPEEFSGIIRVKIHPPTPSIIISSLKELFSNLTPEEFNKRLVILERDGFRIR